MNSSTEKLISQIAVGVSTQVGDHFFQNLLKQLGKAFDADYALLGVLSPPKFEQVETLAMCAHGKIVDNISYSLAETPCANVIANQSCIYPDNVQALFPKDKLLVDMQIDSYLGTPLIDSQGKAIGIIALMSCKPMEKSQIFVDVMQIFASRVAAEMERVATNSELLRTKNKLTRLLEDTSLAVIEWSKDFTVISWNKAAEKTFGYSKEEAIGRTPYELILPEDIVPNMEVLWLSILSDTAPVENVNENVTKSGQKIFCRWVNTPLYDDLGKVSGCTSFAVDVTSERQALKRVSCQKREQNEILNALIDSAVIFDESGKVFSFNPAAEKLSGFAREEIVGMNINMFIPELVNTGSGKIKQQIDLFLEQESGEQLRKVSIQNASGEPVLVRLSVSELPAPKKNKRRFIAVCQDLRGIKQKEKELRQAQKMDALGKLTGGIAHDFNNMLGIVVGYSELLMEQLREQPILAKYVDQIYRAGERGAELTAKLLAFSRQKSEDEENLNINEVLSGEADMLRKLLTARVEVRLELAPEIWTARIEKNALQDALLNMSINALHAMPHGGCLTITTTNACLSEGQASRYGRNAGDYVTLKIKDTGCGMPAAVRDRVFEPFFSTKDEKGTGLGLSQVYGFMKASRGIIDIFSEPGMGTELTLYFPREKQTSDENLEAVIETTESYGGTESILVVDDEVVLCELAREMLSSQGYQVMIAHNGKQALELLAAQSFDVMLTDIIMPQMSGYQLAAEVRKKYPEMVIIFASGFRGEQTKNAASREFSEPVISKPYSSKTLLTTLREEIKKHPALKTQEKDDADLQVRPCNEKIETQRTVEERINWDDALSIDQGGAIDKDHKELISILHRCQALKQDAEYHHNLHQLVAQLIDFGKYHFRREEAIMRACQYPYYQEHVKAHKTALEKVNQLSESENDAGLHLWLTSFLVEWIKQHIIVMDKDITNFTQGKQAQIEKALRALED